MAMNCITKGISTSLVKCLTSLLLHEHLLKPVGHGQISQSWSGMRSAWYQISFPSPTLIYFRMRAYKLVRPYAQRKSCTSQQPDNQCPICLVYRQKLSDHLKTVHGVTRVQGKGKFFLSLSQDLATSHQEYFLVSWLRSESKYTYESYESWKECEFAA